MQVVGLCKEPEVWTASASPERGGSVGAWKPAARPAGEEYEERTLGSGCRGEDDGEDDEDGEHEERTPGCGCTGEDADDESGAARGAVWSIVPGLSGSARGSTLTSGAGCLDIEFSGITGRLA